MKKSFVQLPNSIARNPKLTNSEFRVLIVLMSVNPCYPAHSDIARWTGLNKDTVNRTLKSLKAKNVISWKKGHGYGKNNQYKVHPQKFWKYPENPYTENTPHTTRKTNDLNILIRDNEIPINQNDVELSQFSEKEITDLKENRKKALD